MVVSQKLKEAEDTGQYSLLLVFFPSLRFAAGEPSDLVSTFRHSHVVEAEFTEQDSLFMTRNFLATAMFNEGLFYLNDEYMKLMPMDAAESHLLIEKGVYNGLLRKYFIFRICETLVSSRDRHGGTFKSTAYITLNQLRRSSKLGELMTTLDKMLDEPQDYKPPFFWGCLETEAQYPLMVEVGNVNRKRLVLTLKISHSQGNYLELTDVFSNFPLLSLAISEDIMDQLETEVVISETGKDTYVKNRDKGKSIIEPCENENDFMQDYGKRTRLVTKIARCKFFAEGFCPFGDECWFSHHVGSDGNSCCIFSCEASGSDSKGKSVLELCENENYLDPLKLKKGSEAVGDADSSRFVTLSGFVLGRCCWDTSVSKVFRKPELSLAGVRPGKKTPLETAKESVRVYPDHVLTPPNLRNIFGQKLYDMCYGKGVPPLPDISCWFERFKNKNDKAIYENQLLRWRSPKRSPNWGEGVTRVNREWVELSEGDKKKVGPIRSEEEHKVVGDVRDQGNHQLCAAYVCVNLVSSLRVIEGDDKDFVNLSVKELCFSACGPVQEGHKCRAMLLTSALEFIKDHGVTEQRGTEGDSFSCVTDKPPRKSKAKKIRIADFGYLGNDTHRALKRLETQPIGATLVIFSDYWGIQKGEIYRGPKSDRSRYEALHGVTIVDAFLIDGELVYWCKSSHGEEYHDKGYVLVSGETMVLGHHFSAGRGESRFGVNRGVGGDTALALSKPKGLIHEFVYPVLRIEPKKRKR